MDVEGFLDALRRDPEYADQIVHVHREPDRVPQWEPVPDEVHAGVRAFLSRAGVSGLYRHQAEAVRAALDGRDVLITTGAASGKSLCYQIPILQRLLDDPEATALLIFPTKALARDQVESWNRGIGALTGMVDPRDLAAVPFDADAGPNQRRTARESARVLVTNPEMLHVNLLPRHIQWGRFLMGLRWVVLDEVHTYAGFFGANFANVVRRLSRVCGHYGADPRFVCASATVGNPQELAERLTGRRPVLVNGDTSASGSRTTVLWNPPRIKSRRWRGRRSANVEAHELMVKLVKQGVPTICFSKARNTAEMIYRYVRDALPPELAGRVAPYRGGYTAEARREMERRLRDGDLLGVSATRALELGIDVGPLDACLVVGYPGTLNAFTQQIGRAGRSGRDSLAILVGIDTPINQYIMQRPEFIFGRPVEQAVVDRDNPFVVLGHLKCAAAELPIKAPDVPAFGYASELALEVLEEKGKVRKTGDAWYHATSEVPSRGVRLRGYGDETTVVMDVDTGKVIDRLDKFRALRIFYPGAVYFHLGDTYEMVHHDTDRNIVEVRRSDVAYYTDPSTGTSVDHIDAILDERPLGEGKAYLGEVFALSVTPTYERIQFYTLDRLSQHEIESPPITYEAMSFWLEPPEEIPNLAAQIGFNAEGGMQGLMFCVSRILPLFLTSDANDFDWSLGCRNASWQTMFWFEFYLRGIGHAEQCYERLEEILAVTLEHLLTCDCEDGCPNCTSRLITPYHVRNIELGEGNIESRRAAAVILNSLLTGQSVPESVALLDVPRKRGQRFLPAITDEYRQTEPHRIPVDEKMRGQLAHKIERDEQPFLPADHPIDFDVGVGRPPEQIQVADAQPEEGDTSTAEALHRRGGSLSRKLRRKLRSRPQPEARGGGDRMAGAPEEAADDGIEAEQSGESEDVGKQAIRAGDPIAERARKLKRRRR